MAPAQNDLGIEFEALYGPVMLVTQNTHLAQIPQSAPNRRQALNQILALGFGLMGDHNDRAVQRLKFNS